MNCPVKKKKRSIETISHDVLRIRRLMRDCASEFPNYQNHLLLAFYINFTSNKPDMLVPKENFDWIELNRKVCCAV